MKLRKISKWKKIPFGNFGTSALTAKTDLCNFMLKGKVLESICKYIYGATLCALYKKDGGIRPIAIGVALRRLVSTLCCAHVRDEVIIWDRNKLVSEQNKVVKQLFMPWERMHMTKKICTKSSLKSTTRMHLPLLNVIHYWMKSERTYRHWKERKNLTSIHQLWLILIKFFCFWIFSEIQLF